MCKPSPLLQPEVVWRRFPGSSSIQEQKVKVCYLSSLGDFVMCCQTKSGSLLPCHFKGRAPSEAPAGTATVSSVGFSARAGRQPSPCVSLIGSGARLSGSGEVFGRLGISLDVLLQKKCWRSALLTLIRKFQSLSKMCLGSFEAPKFEEKQKWEQNVGFLLSPVAQEILEATLLPSWLRGKCLAGCRRALTSHLRALFCWFYWAGSATAEWTQNHSSELITWTSAQVWRSSRSCTCYMYICMLAHSC